MVVRLHGGLGNQLFQLLAARYLKEKGADNPVKIYIGDLHHFATQRSFEISSLLSSEQVIEEVPLLHSFLFRSKTSKLLSRASVHSVATVNQLKHWKGQFLNGYFHDIYNYQDHVLVNKLVLQIADTLSEIAPVSFHHLPFDPSNSCAIHLRLSDFLQIGNGKKFLLEYRLPFILNIIRQLRQQEKLKDFIVFTDDIVLAKQLLTDSSIIFFDDYSTSFSLLEEFHLLSKFSYLIPSNSTFSFWTSILGEKKFIYFPSIWKDDDALENEIFLKNIEFHHKMFPRKNNIVVAS